MDRSPNDDEPTKRTTGRNFIIAGLVLAAILWADIIPHNSTFTISKAWIGAVAMVVVGIADLIIFRD